MAYIYYRHLDTPIGSLVLAATEQGVCRIGFDSGFSRESQLEQLERWARKVNEGGIAPALDNGVLDEAAGQLEEYFAGRRRDFQLPLDLRGTPFQQRVWQALTRIPYGAVHSYKQVGEAIGASKAVRAVGGANNRNPVPIIVPCHRVIGADGQMVGYAGGLSVKRLLLELEGLALPLTTSNAGVKS